MESGDGLLQRDRLLHGIDKMDASVDQGQQIRRVQMLEGALRNLEQFPDQHCGRLAPLVAFPGRRAQPHRVE